MNPAGFPQAMMAGQGMQQNGNLSNQIKATLFNRFQQQQNTGGWQSMLPPAERVALVMQLSTSLNLAQPNMGHENALKGALAFEAERFTRTASKEQYNMAMRQQLAMLQQKRIAQTQGTNLGQMGNPQNNMPGMMGQPMQNTMSNQGNPMPQQFNAQLGRPMQVSQLPMNGGQAPQGMQMGGMSNQNQGFQAPQQQGNNQGLSQADNQKINQLAQRMLQMATEEQKTQILRQFQQLPIQRQSALRTQLGDPMIAHFRNQAKQVYLRQLGGKMPQQAGQNGMQNGMMGQQTPMMQRQQPQMAGQQDPGVDFSQFMTQQQDAIRSADSGQLVVPASNNPANANNGMMNQGLNGMPMGLAAGQMNAQGMNNAANQMQLQMQQRAAGLTPQQQAAMRVAQSQRVARAQLQAQNGQPNQQNQMNPQMNLGGNQQVTQSPVPHMAQPGVPQGQQQPGATPQQQRPTPTPTPQMPQPGAQFNPQMLQAMQKAAMANGQMGQVRRPLPPDLPPGIPQNIRNFLQAADDDHYKAALDHLRKQQMAGQLQNGLGAGAQGGQMPQMNQGMPNQMMNPGQTPQMNAQALQQLRLAQQRAQQPQNQNQARPGMPMGQTQPEVIQQMDMRDFPRTLLQANSAQMVPAHVKKFRELKEWIMTNPAMAGGLTVQKLTQFQLVIFNRERQAQVQAQAQAQAQMNGNLPGMGGQQNNGQQAGAPGPAPTAPMMPPGGLNNMGQQPQQRMGMNAGMNQGMIQQLQNMNVTPHELALARQSGRFPPQMPDEELRMKMVDMKRQNLMRKLQEQRNMQMQAPPQGVGNQMPNQRMPQTQMPQPPQRPQMPGNQTPQMTGMQTPTNTQNKQTPRPNQQPANIKTPQQTAKNLKRPAPEEVIEIPDGNPAQPQAAQMQATKSQQARNTLQNNQAAQAAAQAAAPDVQTQAIYQRFGAILQEVKSKHQSRPPVALSDQERQQLAAKVETLKQIITRTEWAIRLFFGGSRDEERTKMYLTRYWHLADNVNPKEGILVSQPTVNAADFENLMQPFKELVLKMMQSKRQQQENAQKAQGQGGATNQMNGQQPPQQNNAQAAQPGPQQLNAANLEQHTNNLRQQGHRRSSSKAQAPAAPTAGPGQNPFNFNTASPQGVPKYGEGAGNLTADKLNLPRKKQKKDGQPPSASSTPAPSGMGTTASPRIGKAQSPQIKKQPAPEMPQVPQPPRNPCPDTACDYNRKGFNTPQELNAHVQQVHAPPADPIKYALEGLAGAVGLNNDGSIKMETPDAKPMAPAAGKAAPHIKAGATPPAGATPLNKIPMKGSPAMDRLKMPHSSGKPAAPTSAAGSAADKAIKTEPSSSKAGEQVPAATTAVDENALPSFDIDFDPWKESAIQQNDLLEWLKPFDTFTGDWGNDRAFRSPQLTPATTPDTNVTDKTASTRDSEILDGDALNMTLAVNGSTLPLSLTDPLSTSADFMTWKEVEGWEPGIMDQDLMSNLAAVGIDESLVLNLDEKTDINDWEALFGAEAAGMGLDGGKVPGWTEGGVDEMVF